MAESHPAHLAHQFDHVEQQREASTFGMWIFLVTEVMFFGGLFLAYTVYRWAHPEAFIVGSHLLDIGLGGFNTVVLLASSLTMAMAVHSAQTGKQKLIAIWLTATIALGLVFLGVKVVEYGAKIEHHLVPGPNFHLDPGHVPHGEAHAAATEGGAVHNYTQALQTADPRHVQLFFSLYFTMTGMHAIHMIIGIGIMSVLLFMNMKGKFTPDYYNPVEISGLYWHFVDIVWIFLFPLLYLIGRH